MKYVYLSVICYLTKKCIQNTDSRNEIQNMYSNFVKLK